MLNAQTLPLSALMVIPALAGMQLGFALQDRMDVTQFRRWTLILLVIGGVAALAVASGMAAITAARGRWPTPTS